MCRYGLSGSPRVLFTFDRGQELQLNWCDIVIVHIRLIQFGIVILGSLASQHLRRGTTFKRGGHHPSLSPTLYGTPFLHPLSPLKQVSSHPSLLCRRVGGGAPGFYARIYLKYQLTAGALWFLLETSSSCLNSRVSRE